LATAGIQIQKSPARAIFVLFEFSQSFGQAALFAGSRAFFNDVFFGGFVQRGHGLLHGFHGIAFFAGGYEFLTSLTAALKLSLTLILWTLRRKLCLMAFAADFVFGID